ncbi:unnamed protein product [Penicillium palitans]
MSAQQQSLSQWVTQINDTLFIQPNDEIALKAVDDQVDPSLVVRINHNVYNYDQFKAGLQYARGSSISIQDEFSVILQWENLEKPDGVVASHCMFPIQRDEDSLVVTHPTTNSPACGLSTAERTGSPVFHTLWSNGETYRVQSIGLLKGERRPTRVSGHET